MEKYSYYLIALILMFIPLYPKFPLFGVGGTFVSIRLEDILVAAILLVYFVFQLKKRFADVGQPIHRAIILYWLIGISATFTGIFLLKSASMNLGILHMARRVEYMSLFFVAYDFLKNKNQLVFLTRILLVVSLIVALYGLGQLYLNFPVISTTNSEFSKGFALSLGPGARINSTFAGHYDLAAFCIIPLLLLLALIPQSKHKFLLIFGWSVIYWAMLMSASRITFVSFFAAAGLLVLVIRKPKWLAPLLVAAIFGFFMSPQLRGRYLELIKNQFKLVNVVSVYAREELVATPESRAVDTVPDALKPAAQTEDRSFNIRLNAEWPRAIRAFSKNPILGTGFSSIGLATDNEYLRILAETGALGLLAFGLIAIRYYKSAWGILTNYKPDFTSAFIAAVSCSLAGLLMSAVFIDIFTASKIALVLWTILGLAHKAMHLKSSD